MLMIVYIIIVIFHSKPNTAVRRGILKPVVRLRIQVPFIAQHAQRIIQRRGGCMEIPVLETEAMPLRVGCRLVPPVIFQIPRGLEPKNLHQLVIIRIKKSPNRGISYYFPHAGPITYSATKGTDSCVIFSMADLISLAKCVACSVSHSNTISS